MMAAVRTISLLLCCCLWVPRASISAEQSSEMEEWISGLSFRAIQIAEEELKRRGLNVLQYRIRVWRRESSLYVIFEDPIADGPSVRGSLGKAPGFWVELDPGDLHIVKSAFTK